MQKKTHKHSHAICIDVLLLLLKEQVFFKVKHTQQIKL